jgi:hypothetical protein
MKGDSVSTKIDVMTKILMALTVVMTVLIAAVVYMVLFSPTEPRSKRGRDEVEATRALEAKTDAFRCDASDVDGPPCPDGHYCRFDTCVPRVAVPICDEAESCRECECAAGLVCHQNRCFAADKVDRAPLICETDARLSEAVRTLADKCTKRKKNVDEIVSAGACTAKDWEALALEDDKFDLILAAFPDRFAVHFPSGKPYLKRQDWPTDAIRGHYLGRLRKYQEALRTAKQIFVIGRASPDGDPKTNNHLAVRRMNLVSDLIEALIYEGIPMTERSRHRVPIRSFAVPTATPIDPGKYGRTYLDIPEDASGLTLDHLITWDDASHKDMRAALSNRELLKKDTGRAWQEIYGAVNRVVLVIPIPCTGTEYRPPSTDVPREAPVPLEAPVPREALDPLDAAGGPAV